MGGALGAHLAAAIEDHEELVQIPMGVRADLPVIEPAAIGDGFDVHEALVRRAGRLAI